MGLARRAPLEEILERCLCPVVTCEYQIGGETCNGKLRGVFLRMLI